MIVRVRLFAIARQLASRDLLEFDLPAGATVADVRQALSEQVPGLASMSKYLQFSVNQEYAVDSILIPPDAEVACIPPVSGG